MFSITEIGKIGKFQNISIKIINIKNKDIFEHHAPYYVPPYIINYYVYNKLLCYIFILWIESLKIIIPLGERAQEFHSSNNSRQVSSYVFEMDFAIDWICEEGTLPPLYLQPNIALVPLLSLSIFLFVNEDVTNRLYV